MDVSASSGASGHAVAAAKTALNVQKQEGNNAVQLIQSAAEASQQTAQAASGGSTISVVA